MQVTSIFKRSVVVTLVFTMLAMVMTLQPVGAKGSLTNKTDFSGEELFRGIFFLQGDVVNYIPELKKVKDSLPEAKEPEGEALKFMDSVILAMNELDAAYFKNLENAMYSKNPNQIKSELEYGAELLVKTNLIPLNELADKDKGAGEGRCAVYAVGSVSVVVVSIALEVAVGVEVYVVVTSEYWFGLAASNNGNGLSGERLISSLAVNL
ncbi:hypothetical protein [Paenibacillus sp.]|uniref:hypothetical protein n=1 Tax=Paenibacillus sp. TaxID=58172 RepID=UPI002822C02F|nr:hypothetical protein [Paenibacillus sp.]MDR0266570.1 hypothetical protein [Paenibacillus sp.]